jgi:hypothetical protein
MSIRPGRHMGSLALPGNQAPPETEETIQPEKPPETTP